MKLLKIILFYFVFLNFALISIHCGSDPVVEGEKAFQSKNYNLAIKHFLEAKKKNPADKEKFNEKIALSYMLRGEKLYQRSRNVKSFNGNFEKGLNYIPEQTSVEFDGQYSEILYSLGTAYLKTKPENKIQKEEYLNKSISYFEDALVYNDQNSKADSVLEKIKADNFQKMLTKGNDFYNKARKTGNSDHYLTAEYYFQRAAYFDIHNKEAEMMLSKTRAKTLSILNNREDFAIAVADMSRQAKVLILDLTIKNYAIDPIDFSLAKFKIFDIDGNEYHVDKETMNSKFKGKTLSDQKFGELKSIDGIVVFAVPSKIKLDYLGYEFPEGEIVKKYFP